jgi:uncharacterized phage protein gp47/JayE
MAKLQLKSKQQITGDMAKIVLARTGLTDLNPGSVLLSLLQAAANEDFAQYYQMLQILRVFNLDSTTGTDLDNRAFEFGITRKNALAASGRISILREASFTKIYTSFYTGFRSRIAGDTEIFVNNAEEFPTSGGQQTLIIGRGTPNEEEVTYTPSGTNPQDNTNYFKIVLDIPLANDHSQEETVILKQGSDTFITSGTVVRVPASGRTSEITFQTTVDATILAGDDRVDDINVICTQPGVIGNIGVNAINDTGAFANPPFSGARAFNESAFSNGQNRETDTALRNRIKAHIQGLSQSTRAGIANAIDGLVDSDTAKRVVSSSIILPDNVGLPVKIYIDDGNGFEPDFKEQGQEIIISSAQGGEKRLQLDLFPIVKAQVETLQEEPFNMSTNGLTLQVNIGNQSETIQFFQNEFSIPEAATSEEVVRAINNTATLFEARTSQIGKKIVINAKSDTNEDIQVVGGTANAAGRLSFPTNKVQTFYLYKNDLLLSKDGETAFIDSGDQEPFDFSGPDRNLEVVVDGKTANPQIAVIQESDFASPAAAAVATAQQLAEIINEQIAGATAVGVNGRLRLISNTELSDTSKIKVNASTAQVVLNYSTAEVIGKNQDYKLNPELGIVELVTPLTKYDLVTAGSRNTRAFLTAGIAQNYTFAGGETLDISIDGDTPQTITFSSGVNLSAAAVAAAINSQLVGGTATTRTYGLDVYLEIRTNTLDPDVGSIEILSSSTANNIFGFTLDTVVENLVPHTAFVTTQNSGPYGFAEGNTLVVVVDNDTGKTFVITLDYDSVVISGSSTTQFIAAALAAVFPVTGSLIDFWVVFKSGANTIEGDIEKVDNPTPNTFRYYFKNPPPTNFEDFDVGDQASFSDMDEAVNDGNYLITAVVQIGTVFAPVITRTLSNPSVLTPVSGDRYLVGTDAGLSVNPNAVISRLIANPSALMPSLNDRYIIAPGASSTTLADVQGRYVDSNDVQVQEVHGYRYIIDGVGLNDWAGQNNKIAQYNGVGTPGWIFITPSDGDVVYSIGDTSYYQFSSGSGTWSENQWGGKAGRIATWSGSDWTFTIPLDKEIRTVTSESKKYQYATSTNTWTYNEWGGKGNQLAQWNGTAWVYQVPSTNDTVLVTDESETYQYNGTAWAIFKFWIEVANSSGITETATAGGSGLLGQRRRISAYNGTTGAITLATVARATPAANDDFVILPGTRSNVVTFFNNTKVTSLSTKAYIELAEQGDVVQISSKLNGSDGYIQVTGGRANDILQFSNTLYRGLRAYAYYTGLIKLVHSTIYGDEQDLVTFPGVGASGVKFQILPPTVQETGFSVDVQLADGISLSSVENDVKTKIIAYVNGLGIAKPIILSAIVEKVREVQGIVDVKIQTPTDNVIISDNELARTKASIISIRVVV